MVEALSPGCPSPEPLGLCAWEAIDNNLPFDYHLHTTYTDGAAGVKEMAKAAVARGIARILFSEHVRHGSEYFPSFFSEVRALRFSELNAFVGVETKILDFEGSLDCSPQIASLCDSIIGSVHSLPHDGGEKASHWSQLNMERAVQVEFHLALAIVTKSRAHILGHPMGMVMKNFNVNPADRLFDLACACRENNKAFEINARYCLEPCALIDIVQRAHCKVSFGSDAHEASQVGNSWYMFSAHRSKIV